MLKIEDDKLVLYSGDKRIKEFIINYTTDKYVCVQRATSRHRIPLSAISS